MAAAVTGEGIWAADLDRAMEAEAARVAPAAARAAARVAARAAVAREATEAMAAARVDWVAPVASDARADWVWRGYPRRRPPQQ